MIHVNVSVQLPTGSLDVMAQGEPSPMDADALVAMALLGRCVNSVGAHYRTDVKDALETLRSVVEAVSAVAPEPDVAPTPMLTASRKVQAASTLAERWETEAEEGPAGSVWRVAAKELRDAIKDTAVLTDEQKRHGMLPEDMLS